ncbi:exported hypothetical protein [Candidatus Defluviicoccus seviourii]|uniref:SHOCT domain-containing protein n=1 Tax=Candidatus Defluviicoccus seviourii TaxID=2565273 RepID=A0A564WF33_9PROT|nr:exported hypothetical protein [Candidatus Defluviicoccus seviourii]
MLVKLAARSLAGLVVIASALFAGVAGHAPAYAHSDWAAPFLGGIMAGRVLTNMQNQRAQQTRAMQEMAGEGGSAGGHSRPTSHSPAQLSPQERLQQLDQLAAGGYITPQEYKARREAILNGM